MHARLRRLQRRASAPVALAVLALALLGACSEARPKEELTVYSGRGQALIGPLLERFADETGISVLVRYDDSANLALQIDTEGDRTPADIFVSQSPGTVGFLAARDKLAPIDAALLERVPEAFRSHAGTWVGLSGRRRVLVYNRDLVRPEDLPASVFDLTDVRYAGKVGLAPTNASFEDFVTAMIEIAGRDRALEWLTAMERAGSTTYPNNNAIVDAVGRGEIPMGLVNHYYNFRALAENPDAPSRNHHFADGDLGSLILVSTATVLRTSDQKDAAMRLVDFLLSDEAQRYFTEEDYEYPLVTGVPPREGLPPLNPASSPAIDLDSLGDKLQLTLDLIEQSGLVK